MRRRNEISNCRLVGRQIQQNFWDSSLRFSFHAERRILKTQTRFFTQLLRLVWSALTFFHSFSDFNQIPHGTCSTFSFFFFLNLTNVYVDKGGNCIVLQFRKKTKYVSSIHSFLVAVF